MSLAIIIEISIPIGGDKAITKKKVIQSLILILIGLIKVPRITVMSF
jgi:hypothetical protein